MVSTHSGRLPITVITTSPRPTPAASSPAAAPAAARVTSPTVHSRRPPSRASSTSASSPGGAPAPTSRATAGKLPGGSAWSLQVKRGLAARVGVLVGAHMQRTEWHVLDGGILLVSLAIVWRVIVVAG